MCAHTNMHTPPCTHIQTFLNFLLFNLRGESHREEYLTRGHKFSVETSGMPSPVPPYASPWWGTTGETQHFWGAEITLPAACSSVLVQVNAECRLFTSDATILNLKYEPLFCLCSRPWVPQSRLCDGAFFLLVGWFVCLSCLFVHHWCGSQGPLPPSQALDHWAPPHP